MPPMENLTPEVSRNLPIPSPMLSKMLPETIPPPYQERFQQLRPGRKMIMIHYFQVHQTEQRSPYYAVPHIAKELGYALDQNGTNTFLLQVIQEFLGR